MRLLLLSAILLPTFVLAQTPPASPDVAATVNGQAISLADVDAAVGVNLPRVPLALSQRKQLRASVVEDLIDDALLKQFLDKHAVKSDPAELDAQLKALSDRLAKEKTTLAEYLKETGQTEAKLREAWALQNRLAAHVKAQVTDEQLKAFHAANRDHFDGVEVRVSHVVIRVSKNAPAAERAAAKEKLQAVRAELAAGKLDFASAARKFSQCPSAKDGGDLGFVRRRGLPEDELLAKAAFSLKIAELSDVVETDYGFHVLTITARKPGVPSAFEKITLDVLEDYTDDYRVELVKKLRKEAQIKITLP